jgi:hypothetical protein
VFSGRQHTNHEPVLSGHQIIMFTIENSRTHRVTNSFHITSAFNIPMLIGRRICTLHHADWSFSLSECWNSALPLACLPSRHILRFFGRGLSDAHAVTCIVSSTSLSSIQPVARAEWNDHRLDGSSSSSSNIGLSVISARNSNCE